MEANSNVEQEEKPRRELAKARDGLRQTAKSEHRQQLHDLLARALEDGEGGGRRRGEEEQEEELTNLLRRYLAQLEREGPPEEATTTTTTTVAPADEAAAARPDEHENEHEEQEGEDGDHRTKTKEKTTTKAKTKNRTTTTPDSSDKQTGSNNNNKKKNKKKGSKRDDRREEEEDVPGSQPQQQQLRVEEKVSLGSSGSATRAGATTVVVDKSQGEVMSPPSRGDPPCFADDLRQPGFEIADEDEEDDTDHRATEEEELVSLDDDEEDEESAEKEAHSGGDDDDAELAEEELHEDVEKEAEDRLHERFLDYDKIWEHTMATPQGLLGQVRKGFIRPALIEVSNGSLLHARLSFKGGGQLHHEEGVRLSAREVLAAGPVRTRVLFGTQEGWPFQVPLKKGHKKKVYNVAAGSQDEAQVWLHTVLEAPKDSTKSVRGFLWVQSAQTGKWSRYYCIADPSHFEWFRTKEVKAYDLKSLLAKNMKLTGSQIGGSSYNESSPMTSMKSTPKVSKKALRSYHMRELKNYKHELILWTKEKPIKKVFHFMTESNDRRLFWKNLLATSAETASANKAPSLNIEHSSLSPSSQTSSPHSSKPGSRASSRPSSAYSASSNPLADSASSSSSSAPSPVVPDSHNHNTPSVTFSGLPSSSNPFQPSPASTYMAIRFSSLSEHMAYALKSVGEEEKKTEKKKRKKDKRNGSKREDSEQESPFQTPGSTPETRPRFNTLSKDSSIFRSGVGLETKETTQLRNELRDLMERADREAGKTSFGNYSLAKSGVGDGHVRVIALDGGGLRAIMEAVILERLVEVFPDLLERTDMFAGISGGSMLAAGLVCGRSPAFIRKLLEVLAPRVFNPKGRFRTGKAIQSSKFANKNLLVAGSEVTKNLNLDELQPKMLLIPSFLLDNGLVGEERSWEPLLFHNVTLSRELDPLRLQGSGDLRSHKRSSSIDDRNKGRSGTAPDTMLRELHKEKEKEAARKKERKRGSSEHSVAANRTFTLRPPNSTSQLSTQEKNHKRTRSSADDLARVVAKDRSKESLLSRPDNGLNSSGRTKTQKKDKEAKALEPDTAEDSDDDDDELFSVDEDRHIPIWDCVMGSSAAPTYFPSYKRQIDAAVMCNNPSLAAIAVLMSERARNPKTPKQIHMLSLGTGRLSQFIDGEHHDWGMIKWAPWLLQIMIGATSLYEQKQAQAILGPRYHRVDPFLPAPLAMDDPLLLSVLVEQAKKVDLEETIEWIEENWYTEEERRERRAKRDLQNQEREANNTATGEGPDDQGTSDEKRKKAAADKKKRKKRGNKDNRKSVYAPVGKEGEEPTLRGTWGEAAWFGSLGTGGS